jgi:dihydrofolate synthase/folylpolyglutamate synthase
VLQEEPLVLVDVAHNPPGIEAGLRTLDRALTRRGGTLYVGFNAVRGKQLAAVARLLAARDARVIPVPVDTPRALSPEEITETLEAHGAKVLDARPLEQVLDDFQRWAEAGDVLLLTGSHKMVELLPDAWADRP